MQALDSVRVTTVVDNFIDATVMSSEEVDRFDTHQHISRRHNPVNRSGTLVQAEHGVSLLVDWERGSESGRLLFDTGWTPEVLMNNLAALEVDPETIDAVVISHAHIDHHGGLFGLLEHTPGIPVYTSFEGFHPKFIRDEDGETVASLNEDFNRETLRQHTEVTDLGKSGRGIVPGIRSTGEIPQRTAFEPPVVLSDGPAGIYRRVDGNWEPDDPPRDEQGLVLNLRDRWGILLAGCSHPGIVNMAHRARDLLGETPLRAVMGGFHTGAQPPEKVDQTMDAFRELDLDLLSPMHCTGHHVVDRMGREFEEAFVLNMVGTGLTF